MSGRVPRGAQRPGAPLSSRAGGGSGTPHPGVRYACVLPGGSTRDSKSDLREEESEFSLGGKQSLERPRLEPRSGLSSCEKVGESLCLICEVGTHTGSSPWDEILWVST